MLLHQLVHLSTGNRQVFAPEHQSVFMHPLDLRFRRVHQGQRFETFRQVSRYRERYREGKKMRPKLLLLLTNLLTLSKVDTPSSPA